MNQVCLVGRFTKDAELRQVGEGKVVSSFTLAVNRNFKNHDGQTDADFLTCNVWGSLAEHIVKYCSKGSLIGVSGRLQTRSYTNSLGQRMFVMDVLAHEIRFLQLKEKSTISTSEESDFSLPTISLQDQIKLET